MFEKTLRAAARLAIVAAFAASLTAAAGTLHPVALTGTSGPLGPGMGPGVTFSNMVLIKTIHPEFGTTIPAAPSISTSGAVCFGASLAGPGITTANGSGIFAVRGGPGPSLVARRGDQIPYMAPGYTFGELFTAPQISGVNTVAFQAAIEGNDSSIANDEATFTERSGWIYPLIREGVTPVPERLTPQGVFGNQGLPAGDPWGNNQWVMNRGGDIALRCFVNDGPSMNNNFSGIYTDFGGPLAKHSRPGDTYTSGPTTYTFTGQSNPRFNDSGAMFTARLSDVAFSLTPWSTRARDANGFGIPGVGPLHPLFIQGATAPGTNAPFYSVESLVDFSLNANGRVGFAADLNGGGPGAAGGYWSDARFGSLQLIALSGAQAPGTPTGQVFNTNAQFVLGSALSDNNCVVLNARLLQGTGVGGGNDTGLWTTRSATTGLPGNLRLLVREGSPVPSSAGPDFDGLNFGEISSFWVNASGRVAFVTLHNDFTRALWIEQADGSLVPVVKEFTLLDVSGNGTDQRLISTIDVLDGFAATGDGRRTAFNDNGDVALRIVFNDGSEGIFTTAPAIACSAPAEQTPPASQTVGVGDAVSFSVVASGTGPIRHQWRYFGEPIDGAIDATFTIASVADSDAGMYDCVLSNACGETISTAAILTVGTGPACDPDVNQDGVADQGDVDYLINVIAGGENPSGIDPDFNQDGVADQGDVDALINVVAGGPCP